MQQGPQLVLFTGMDAIEPSRVDTAWTPISRTSEVPHVYFLNVNILQFAER